VRAWWSLRQRCRDLDELLEVSARQVRWSRLRRSCRDKGCEPVWVRGRGVSLPAPRELWRLRLPLNIKVAPVWFQDRVLPWYLRLQPFKARDWAEAVPARPQEWDRKSYHLRPRYRVAAV
jgi:hypothetical protein